MSLGVRRDLTFLWRTQKFKHKNRMRRGKKSLPPRFLDDRERVLRVGLHFVERAVVGHEEDREETTRRGGPELTGGLLRTRKGGGRRQGVTREGGWPAHLDGRLSAPVHCVHKMTNTSG